MERVSAFWLTVVLIVAIVGCVEPVPFQYDLTVSSTAGGSVTDPGEGRFEYDSGTAVTLLAEAGEGHRFVNWSGTVGTVDDADAASTTVTMRGDYSITANFEAIPGLTISSTAGGSVMAPGEGTFTYESETTVRLVAVAHECYRFVSWTGDAVADPSSATTTISISGDAVHSVTANFALLRYDLSADSIGGGSVSVPGEGTFTYDCGTVVDLVGVPDPGYRFLKWAGDVVGIEDVDVAETTIAMSGNYSIMATFVGPMVSGGAWHTLGLGSDATVLAVGHNGYGQCNIDDWTDLVQIEGGGEHTVGLRWDGTVLAVGYNEYGQCDVGGWSDIVQVSAGRRHTVGLKPDGTVVAVGYNAYGQCDVGGWTDIVQIVAGANAWHTVGLKSDGSVVAVGANWAGQCDAGDWAEMVQVASGGHHTVGLKPDGTVVAVGRNNYGECNLDAWTGIVQVVGGCQLTVGLKSDGTVVAAGWNDYGQCYVGAWKDIVRITAGMVHTVGLKSDGTVVATGSSSAGQCNVGDWILS